MVCGRGASTTVQAAAEDVLQSDPSDPDAVIPTLLKLETLLGKASMGLEFPRVVVVGNQSSGKSSVLEALVGADFLPKGTNMVTTRPLELNLLRSASGTWAEFEDGRKIVDFGLVQDILAERNSEDEFSDEPIRLSIFAPHVHNVAMVDLPGYIHAIRKGYSAELPRQIHALCAKYINDPNNLIVAVASAADDVAMSFGIKEAQTADTEANRSIGVLTKMDLIRSRKHLVPILQNEDYPLGIGYCGVRCRTQKELEAGKSFEDILKIEERFIKRSKLREKGEDLALGIPVLRRMLSEELLRKTSDSFPHILSLLDLKIEEASKDEQFLLAISAESDLSNIARELERLVNKFHPSSPDRLEFEAQVRDDIQDIVHDAWFGAVDKFFEFSDPPNPLASPQLSARLTESYSRTDVDADIQRLSRAILRDSKFDHDEHFGSKRDRIERFMVFGAGGTPDKFDDTELVKLGMAATVDGALAPFYRYVIPDNISRARPSWQESLEATVESVLSDSDLVNKCRDTTVASLLDFVDRAARVGTARESQLALNFFRYLVKRVAEDINSEGLVHTIEGMIRREQRAVVSYPKLAAETAEILKSPKPLSGIGLWSFLDSDAKWPLVLPVYGQVFTQAYSGAVVDRVSEDVFRSIAVELLSPLVLQSLHTSLKLFKAGKIRREAKRQLKRLNELKKYRRVIENAQIHYGRSE